MYFCCAEALQNVVKHAGASHAVVRASCVNGSLAFSVVDDGHGYAPADGSDGVGIQNMRDRLGALGGELEVLSSDAGSEVHGWLPTSRSN